MEFFHEVNIDWLGKKWYFLGFSLIFSIAGLISLFFWHGLPLGVDFKGGTLIYLKFEQTPDQGRIRSAADRAGLHDVSIVRFGHPEENEVIVSLPERDTKETSLDASRVAIVHTLQQNYASNGTANAGKLDLDNATRETLTDFLVKADPLHLANSETATVQYGLVADKILNYRDKVQHGLIASFSELDGKVEPAVVSALQQGAYLSGFTVRNTEIVGPQVGAQLRQKALLATLYSLAGMLVYLWFRFELIYGVAAVVAVFHDTLITVGAFSLTEPGDDVDRNGGDPDADRLLDERHDRGFRSHSREFEADSEGARWRKL